MCASTFVLILCLCCFSPCGRICMGLLIYYFSQEYEHDFSYDFIDVLTIKRDSQQQYHSQIRLQNDWAKILIESVFLWIQYTVTNLLICDFHFFSIYIQLLITTLTHSVHNEN